MHHVFLLFCISILSEHYFLQSKTIQGNETNIDMNNFVIGGYLLKVIPGNKEVKTLKII
jgi:hypothetical protein